MPDKQSIERHSTRKMGRELHETLNQQGLTQAEAAKQLGVTQPRVSALLTGTWKDFSIDMLLTFAARLGLQPRLTYANA